MITKFHTQDYITFVVPVLRSEQAHPSPPGNSRIKVKVERIYIPTPMINNNNHTPRPIPRPPLLIRRDTTEPGRLRVSSDALMAGEVDAGVAHRIELIEISQSERCRGVLDGGPVDVGRCVV